MKIVHTGDIHLGYSAYGKLSLSGMNQRMMDVFDSFEHMVDFCINEKVDVLMISGDLFHSLKPSMSTLAFCMQQMSRLSDNGIHVLIVGGNHDTPKSKLVSSPLETLKFFDNVTCAVDDTKSVSIGDADFVLVPYIFDKKRLMEELSKAASLVREGRLSVLIIHMAYGKFKMMQYDEVCIEPDETIDMDAFDYVAMGHYHTSWTDENLAYSGSLERLTFNEKDDEKGFWLITTPLMTLEKVKNDAREMVDLPDVDLIDTTSPTSDIVDSLKDVAIKDRIFRMRVKNIPALLYRALDFRELRKRTESATNFEFIFEIQEEVVEYEEVERKAFRSMYDEWSDFATSRHADNDLVRLGQYYIQKADIN